MRVDRGGGKGITSESSRSGKETSIQKKGGKVKVTAGDQDNVQISQNQNSLKIQINDSNSVLLSPEESKNLEIIPGSGRVSVDSNVTIPIKGRLPKSASKFSNSKIDPSVASGRKEETQLTADITRKFLASELSRVPSEAGKEGNAGKMPAVLNAGETPAVPNAGETPAVLNAGETPAVFNAGKMPAVLNAGKMPAVLNAGETPAVLNAGETPAVLNAGETTALPKLGLEKMSPEQKANLLETIMDVPPATNSTEIMYSVLLSAKTPEEFNRIVDLSGGEKVAAAFQTEEMKISWDRLAGGYNRPDLALNPDEASKTSGLLLMETPSWIPNLPDALQQQPLSMNLQDLQIDLNQIDRSTLVCVTLENAVREKTDLPLITPGDLRQQVFEILKSPDLPSGSLPVLLENLRKEVKLSEYQMREIVSLPMMEAFESVVKDLENFQAPRVLNFEKQIQQAIDSYGPESVAVEISKAELSEFLEHVEPQINLFREWKAVTSEIFSGPGDPEVKVDRFVHSILNEIVQPSTPLTSIVEVFTKGSVLFETGKLQECVKNLDLLNIPEIKTLIAPTAHFLADLPEMLKLAPQIPAPEFKSFQFLAHLQNGTFRSQIAEFAHAVAQLRTLPAVQRTVGELTHWRNQYSQSKSPDRISVLNEGQKLIDDLTNGTLLTRSKELSGSIRDLNLDSHLADVIESVRMGGELIVSFRNGRFVQVLAALNQRMAGSPAILQIIQQGLHLTNSGSNFIRSMMNRDWEKPISQALKKNPGSRELREAESIFSDALNLFAPLESIDTINPFVQYQKQFGILRDESLMNDLIQQYQVKAREII